MDFLLDAVEEIAAEVFASVAHLLNLDLDIVLVETTSTSWEVEVPDDLAESLREDADDGETASPAESATRRFGHSKDHRSDLPQVVIAMAVTRDGVPVRQLDLPRQRIRHRDHPPGQGRPGRLELAPAGLGRRPRVRLRGEPGRRRCSSCRQDHRESDRTVTELLLPAPIWFR